MNCPSCNRPNDDGLVLCDYCGTSLTAPPPQKRRTEAEGVAPRAGGGAKRVTEFEPPQGGRSHDDPFDPARAAQRGGGNGGFQPVARPDGGAAPARKRVTEFDSGRPADPFGARTSGADREADDFSAPGRGRSADAEPAAGRRIIGWLITFDGHPDGISFILREGRNVVGREASCDITIPEDGMMSSTHAYIIWRTGRARIADANTQNGTFLNEEDVLGQVEVNDNDVIRVGRTRFLVRLLDAARVAAVWKPAAGA